MAGVNHCSRLQREGAAVSCLWPWVIGAEHDGLTEEGVGGCGLCIGLFFI